MSDNEEPPAEKPDELRMEAQDRDLETTAPFRPDLDAASETERAEGSDPQRAVVVPADPESGGPSSDAKSQGSQSPSADAENEPVDPYTTTIRNVATSILTGVVFCLVGFAAIGDELGWGIFIGVPTLCGFVVAICTPKRQRTLVLTSAVVVFSSALLYFVGAEGVLCVLMAFPIV